MSSSSRTGQSLIELVVGIAVAILFITAATGAILLALRIDVQNKYSQSAGELIAEVFDQVSTTANNDWLAIDSATRDTPMHLATSTGFFVPSSGANTISLNGFDYDVSYSVGDVYRALDDSFADSQTGALDPSTLRITATVSWQQQGDQASLSLDHYLTRIRDRVWLQTDWSNGSSTGSGPFTDPAARFANATNTNWSTDGELTIFDYNQNLFTTTSNGIDPTPGYFWAWNDAVGWIDFLVSHTVTVDSTLTGYAVGTNIGYLALDCATSPNGDICSQSNFSVSKDTSGTGAGILYGYAWSDSIGWISFNCSNQNQCQTTAPCPTTNPSCTDPVNGKDYAVTLDDNYNFFGWAWNDAVGWISFNCDHSGTSDTPPSQPPWDTNVCATSQYQVKTGQSQLGLGELESAIFDTNRIGGVGFNTIMWQGSQPTGTSVSFQIASSNLVGGPWTYLGPDGTTNSFYQPLGPNIQTRINREAHNNDQYIRYKAFLFTNPTQTSGPTINDIIINWSY